MANYYTGDSKYRPLGAWSYFGYTILFNIPIVGLILLIIFSFSDSNINRRNYARSYWCVYLVAIILFAVIALVLLLTAGTQGVANFWNSFISNFRLAL